MMFTKATAAGNAVLTNVTGKVTPIPQLNPRDRLLCKLSGANVPYLDADILAKGR